MQRTRRIRDRPFEPRFTSSIEHDQLAIAETRVVEIVSAAHAQRTRCVAQTSARNRMVESDLEFPPTTAEDRRRWLAEIKEARAADALQIKLFAKALVRDDPKRFPSGSGGGPSLNS